MPATAKAKEQPPNPRKPWAKKSPLDVIRHQIGQLRSEIAEHQAKIDSAKYSMGILERAAADLEAMKAV